MDVSNAPVLGSTNLFCRISSLRPNSSSFTHFRENPQRKRLNPPIGFFKIPSWSRSAVARSGGLKISAILRRPARRRNALREKLIPSREDQVRIVPEISIPDSNSEGSSYAHDERINGETSSELDDERVEAGDENSGEHIFSDNSLLRDKLGNWFDQCKEESEFWGIGTDPISTIYQDSDGIVKRVSINHDEISKRSRLRAWSPEKKEEIEEFADVNSKVSPAELIAKEIESGEYTLPKNSSIAKFIVEGRKSSFVDGLRSVSLQAEPFLKTFPRIGFTVVCGCCVFWALTKFIVGNDKVELTREEVEMLRRKKKSRMEREELEKSSVQVLQDVSEESPVTRPQLDRNQLMKSIMQVKASRESLAIADSSSHIIAGNHEFDNEVREIREMARKVREQEQQDGSQTDKKGGGPSTMSAVTNQKASDELGVLVEAEPCEEQSDRHDTSVLNSLEDNEKNVRFSSDTENKKKMLRENPVDCVNKPPDEESGDTGGKNRDTIVANDGDHNKDVTSFSRRHITAGLDAEKIAHGSKTSASSMNISPNKEASGKNEMESSAAGERISNNSSSDAYSKTFLRNKPKIIKSVKEARKYLAQKSKPLSERVQHDQELQVKELPAEVDAGSCTDKSIHRMAQRGMESSIGGEHLKESEDAKDMTLALEQYEDKIVSSMPNGLLTDKVSEIKLHEADDKMNMLPMEMDNSKVQEDKNGNFLYDKRSLISLDLSDVVNSSTSYESWSAKILESNEELLRDVAENTDFKTNSSISTMEDLNIDKKIMHDKMDTCTSCSSGTRTVLKTHNTCSEKSSDGGFDRSTPLVAKPSKDRVYDSKESKIVTDIKTYDNHPQAKRLQDDTGDCVVAGTEDMYHNMSCEVGTESKMVRSSNLDKIQVLNSSAKKCSEESNIKEEGYTDQGCHFSPVVKISKELEAPKSIYTEEDHDMMDLSGRGTRFSHDADAAKCLGGKNVTPEESWVEKNFKEFDPIIKKIKVGFKENFQVAKEKVQEQSSLSANLSELGLKDGNDELEWMNDESLREIVLQVRENELAGRDPFYLMNADDKRAFFKGLEHKAEKVNAELSGLHEWIHSRIENLDYGADGISLDDPLDKIIPRWRGPAIDKDPEFLNKLNEHQKMTLAGKEDMQNNLQKAEQLPNSGGTSPDSLVNTKRKISSGDSARKSKTVIECSNGTSRPGKKTGKEQWQHTKKWSQGFLEVYNAETDPEIKSIMRDMGKDLDRWMTEKEKQDVADLMTRIPKRKRRYIEKKMDKLKKEVEMFGPQAVVSKYREYVDEKEEDYFWWLDLKFVLCIELYKIEDGTPKVGFYSLEMAADLELNPKQYHVIAFEDPGDSKNFCYIVQAHMDLLGNGKAFVVARPPKDAFREAKANGFSVTVIRKGEVKLNVDQTLEEVEEDLTEIGSKIYHDKVMRDRSVDIRTLMKGVISADKSTKSSTKRKLKRKLAKPKL